MLERCYDYVYENVANLNIAARWRIKEFLFFKLIFMRI